MLADSNAHAPAKANAGVVVPAVFRYPPPRSADLNPYAVDLKTVHDQGGTWTDAMVAIEANDSDGDAVSNINEIDACTPPGVVGTVPVEPTTWGMIKALYR